MLSKKKKIIVIVSMVALLVVAGGLNIFLSLYNKGGDDPVNGGTTTQASFFDTYRVDRQTTRDQTILYLDAIINNEASSEDAIANAEASKLEATTNMEVELVLEGLIKSLGFEDAVVTNSTESVNIIIKSKEITSEQAAQILDVVVTETQKDAINVRIIPVE